MRKIFTREVILIFVDSCVFLRKNLDDSFDDCKKKIHLTSRFWRHNSIRLWRGNERLPLPLFSPGLPFGWEKIGLLLKIILFVIKFLLPAAERRYANATKKFNYFIATARVDTRTGVEESLRLLRDERARQCIPDILRFLFFHPYRRSNDWWNLWFCRHGLWIGERERAVAGCPDFSGADVRRSHRDLANVQHHQQDQ